MSELGRDARSLLDAARDGDDPGAGDRQRVRALVMRRVGVGAAVVSASVVTATTAKGAVASTSSLLLKLAFVAGAISLAASGGVLAVRYARHHATTTEPAPTTSLRATAPTTIAPVVTTALPPLAPPIDEAPSAEPVAIPTPSALVAKPSVAPVACALPPDDLPEELSLLTKAQGALATGDGETALAILDEHAKKFPNGTLAQERNAARCIALCLAGRAGAVAQAEAFIAQHPTSPLITRIQRACGL